MNGGTAHKHALNKSILTGLPEQMLEADGSNWTDRQKIWHIAWRWENMFDMTFFTTFDMIIKLTFVMTFDSISEAYIE